MVGGAAAGPAAGAAAAKGGQQDCEARIELPVLNLRLLGEDGGAARLAAQLGAALEEFGFFFLTQHGVDRALMAGVFAAAASLHALPVTEKAKHGMDEGKLGYIPFGGAVRTWGWS